MEATPYIPNPSRCVPKFHRGRPTFWEVYGLVCLETGVCFYIGCTGVGAIKRAKQHANDRGSCAWRRIKELNETGLGYGVKVFSKHPDHFDARMAEYERIGVTPTALNKATVRPAKRR